MGKDEGLPMDEPTNGPATPPAAPQPPVAPPTVAPQPPVAPQPVWAPPVAPPPGPPPGAGFGPAAVPDPGRPSGSGGAEPGGGAERGGESHRGVALLLGAVAILAALVGARSTALANDATDAWQSALRTEVKRSTAALEDIRYVYQAEVPIAVVVMGGRLKADELRTASKSASGAVAATLAMEAAIEDGVVTAIQGSAPLVTDPAYALAGGGVDLGQRLADERNSSPDLVGLDPDAIALQGDHLASKGSSMTLALLPLGFAALFGAMAQPFLRGRRLLMGAGAAAMGLGAAIALMVEALG